MTSFDKTYYEDGIRTGKSLYENYHWMPERSFVEAHWFSHGYGISLDDRVLDFGCAKGFFVKAMHLLGYERTYGYDTSKYALSHCDPVVKDFLFKDKRRIMDFDYCFCKDVLEHCLGVPHLKESIKLLSNCRRCLVIVPNAKDGKYVIPEYELDTTHTIRFDSKEWLEVLEDNFTVDEWGYHMLGFKQKWVSEYPDGNLFFQLTSKLV